VVVHKVRARTVEELERELWDNRQSLRLALEEGRMGTWTWDIGSDVVVWDDLLPALFGTAAPTTFAGWLASLPPEEAAETRRVVDQALADRTGYRLTRRVAPDDGPVRWLETRASVMVEDGVAVGLRGVTIDVTPREEARLRAERLAEHAATLARAAAELAGTLDPDTVLRRAIDLLVPSLADGCEIAIREGSSAIRRWVNAPDVDAERIRRREARSLRVEDDHPVSEIVRTGVVRRFDAAVPADRAAFGPVDDDTTAASFAVRHALLVPMVVREEVIGVLSLARGRHRPAPDEDEVQLALELAGRVALCFDNARLYERQRSIADTLQASLIPARLPDLPWLELTGRYWVPGDQVQVGGDFYDAVVHGADQAEVTLFIGDVCGKGVAAASITALARHTLRAGLAHLESLDDCIAWLHRALLEAGKDTFLTTALVRLRRAPGGVEGTVANAGHPRPVIVRADGSSEVLAGAGTPVGLDYWRPAPAVPFWMAPGDVLALYTDGVTDVPGEAAVPAERFRELLCGVADQPVDVIAGCIEAELERHQPLRHRRDDIALLIARAVA
jgi:PAS domain S-box-containing protein